MDLQSDEWVWLVFSARIAERVLITLVIIACAITLMIAFRRSLERIKFDTEKKINLSADIVMSTPIFLLLVILGYAYVSFSHPISIEFQGTGRAKDPPVVDPSEGDPEVAAVSGQGEVFTLSGLAPEGERDVDVRQQRDLARDRVFALNCLLETSSHVDRRMRDAVLAANIALLADPVVWDREAWGDPVTLRAWAMGLAAGDPPQALIDIFEGRHDPCVL